jgi:hypothetical protein
MKLIRTLIIVTPLTLLSGCFDGYMDCDDNDNIKTISEVVDNSIGYRAIQAGYYKTMKYHPELEIESFNQIKLSEYENECHYLFNVKLDDYETVLMVDAKIRKFEKGDKTHEVKNIVPSYTITNLVKRSIQKTKQKIILDESIEYGFESTLLYEEYLSLVSSSTSIQDKLKSVTQKIRNTDSSIVHLKNKIKDQEIALDQIKNLLKEKLNTKGKVSEKLTGGVTINIDYVDLINMTMKGTYTNTDDSNINHVELKMYIYDKNNLVKPIFETDLGKTRFMDRYSTHIKVGWKSKFNNSFNKILIKKLRKIVSYKKEDLLVYLAVQKYFINGDSINIATIRKKTFGGTTTHEASKFDIPARISQMKDKIRISDSSLAEKEASIRILKSKKAELTKSNESLIMNIQSIQHNGKISVLIANT